MKKERKKEKEITKKKVKINKENKIQQQQTKFSTKIIVTLLPRLKTHSGYSLLSLITGAGSSTSHKEQFIQQ